MIHRQEKNCVVLKILGRLAQIKTRLPNPLPSFAPSVAEHNLTFTLIL